MDLRTQAQENIRKAKDLFLNSDAEEIYVKYPGFDYFYVVYNHKDGYLASHPCLLKETCCYPPEHCVRINHA